MIKNKREIQTIVIFDIDTLKLINKKKIYTNIDTSAPPIVVYP
jgi:hypothetical protein